MNGLFYTDEIKHIFVFLPRRMNGGDGAIRYAFSSVGIFLPLGRLQQECRGKSQCCKKEKEKKKKKESVLHRLQRLTDERSLTLSVRLNRDLDSWVAFFFIVHTNCTHQGPMAHQL